jgi:ribosomal protein L37AE/L43A
MERFARLPIQMWRRTSLAYRLRCAREDMKRLRLISPAGVWQCAHCEHVALTHSTFWTHLSAAHI